MVSLLVQRWSETWTELAWLRAAGRAVLVEPDAADLDLRATVEALRAKYPQYVDHDLAVATADPRRDRARDQLGSALAPAGEVAQVDAAIVAVHVEPVAAQEPDERDAEPLGGLDRRGPMAPTRHSTIGIPATAAFWTISKLTRPDDHQDALVQRQRAGEDLRSDELVEGVVPADVLADRDELAARA